MIHNIGFEWFFNYFQLFHASFIVLFHKNFAFLSSAPNSLLLLEQRAINCRGRQPRYVRSTLRSYYARYSLRITSGLIDAATETSPSSFARYRQLSISPAWMLFRRRRRTERCTLLRTLNSSILPTAVGLRPGARALSFLFSIASSLRASLSLQIIPLADDRT